MCPQFLILAVVFCLCFSRSFSLDIFLVMPDLTLLCFHFQFPLSRIPATVTRTYFFNLTAAQYSTFFSYYVFFSNYFLITLLNINLEFLSFPFYHSCIVQHHFFHKFYWTLNPWIRIIWNFTWLLTLLNPWFFPVYLYGFYFIRDLFSVCLFSS
jgi:hypothetical protein